MRSLRRSKDLESLYSQRRGPSYPPRSCRLEVYANEGTHHLCTPEQAAESFGARADGLERGLLPTSVQHDSVELQSALEAHKRSWPGGFRAAQVACYARCCVWRHRQGGLPTMLDDIKRKTRCLSFRMRPVLQAAIVLILLQGAHAGSIPESAQCAILPHGRKWLATGGMFPYRDGGQFQYAG